MRSGAASGGGSVEVRSRRDDGESRRFVGVEPCSRLGPAMAAATLTNPAGHIAGTGRCSIIADTISAMPAS